MFNLESSMDKFAKRKKTASRRLFATTSVALCLLGGGFGLSEAHAAPIPHSTTTNATQTVSGTVVDMAGNPLVGANILEKGTKNGIVTDLDGRFSLKVANGAQLEISYVGYESTVVKAASNMEIRLKEDNALLEEVVVVGYGTQKKVNLTGSVANIDVEEAIGSRPITDVAKALQGVSPGLSVTTNVGGLGVDSKIKLRGSTGSLNATEGTSPLILVDNVEVPSLSLVNPDDIASISVLKDAASSSIYGTRAAWGVILITTKTGKRNEKPTVTYSNNFAWSTPTTMPQVAKSYDSAQAALIAAQRAGNNTVSSIGYNIDELAIQKMKEWEAQYGGMSQEELGEMKLGRDFEQRGGKYYFYRSFDPLELFLKDWTPQQKHNLSIAGGSDKTTYNVSLGYLNQKGVIKVNEDTYDRFTLNATVNTQLRDWWSFHSNVMFSRDSKEEPYQYTSGYTDIWYYLLRWPAFYPYSTYQGVPFRSAITEVEQAKHMKTTNNYVRTNVGTTLSPISGLDINFDYTFALYNTYQKREGGQVWGWDMFNTTNPLTYSSFYGTTHDRVSEESNYTMMNTFKAYATYTKTFEDKHNLKVMVGMDAESRENLGHYSERRQLISLDMPEISLAVGDQYVDEGNAFHNDQASAGFFGRINYDYLGKYLLEVNARYDGSSKFPEDDKWALFPSVSAGWRLSDEKFMDWSKSVLSNMKLRGSWGTIGNQDVAANAFLSTMGVGSSSGWIIDGKELPYIGVPSIISPSLTWERISTVDVGFDARFFNNEFGITFDWYQRMTTGMHSPGETLPSTYGSATFPLVNEGEIRGRGFELALDYNHTFDCGLGLTLTANLSKVREVITKYNNPNKNIYGNYEGKILGEIWGYETDRLFQYEDCYQDADGKWFIDTTKPGIADQSLYETGSFKYGPGDVKYKDLNGDGKITYGKQTLEDHGDLKRIGNTLPNFEYGFSLGLTYKGFDFYTFFQGVGSRDVWVVGQTGIPGFMPSEGWLEHQMDYWTPENTDAFYPTPTSHSWINDGQNFLRQTRYLQDMSYLRCKNITLGYTFPESWMKAITFTSGRVYVSAENVFEFTNTVIPVDPETTENAAPSNGQYKFGKSYPFMRTVSFGLQLTF